MINITDILIASYKTLTAKLFDEVSSYDIYCEFIGVEVALGEMILSPIRADSRPTFTLFFPQDSEQVLFNDFAWIGGNVFKFVRYFALYNESIQLHTRREEIEYIDSKLGLGLFDKPATRKSIGRKLTEGDRVTGGYINFSAREFTSKDIKFWNKYHVPIEVLILFKVHSVSKLLDDKGSTIYSVPNNKLTFAFVIFNKVKLYSPEEIEFKWRNTCPATYYQGLQQIQADNKRGKFNKKLIWTKSLKDVIVFYTFLSHEYDVIAPHGESYIPTDDFINSVVNKYDEIVIIYDFDRAGVAGANRLRKRHSKFKVTFVSKERYIVNGKRYLVSKDISDYAEYKEKEEVKNRLIQMGL